MPLYSLIASGRSDVQLSDIVLSRDADGEVEHRVAVGEATEIPDELVPAARSLATKLGYRLLEMESAPKEDSTAAQMDKDAAEKASESTDAPTQEDQPVGVDVVGESPPVSAGDAESPSAPQQGQPNPDASTFSTPSST